MIENNNEKRNKKITVALVILVLLLVTIVGITYAYFSAKSNAVPQKVTTAKVDLVVEVNPEATHVKDIKPTTWNETTNQNDDNEDVVKIPIKVTNRSTIDINYDLFITPDGLALNEAGLDGDEQKLVGGDLADIKYKLYEKTGDTLSENPIKEGDFTKGETKQKIVSNKKIEKEESSNNIQNYILYIYIENKTSEQNKLQGIDFNLDIEGVTPPEKLAQTILANETPIEEQPDFTGTSTDRGLYKLQDNSVATASISSEESNSNNKGSIYYYRGSVDNNYVQFGTYTKNVTNKNVTNKGVGWVEKSEQVAQAGDDILWRIVRINEDGSVKLIAEHNIGDDYHVWNSNDTADYSNSTIKETVDTWYRETFEEPTQECTECQKNKELDNLVLETEFCNDRSNNYNAVRTRLNQEMPKPTLKCADSNDIVRSKAGLISADEMVYAGALYDKKGTDNTTYLNNKTSFWTISPGSFDGAFLWFSPFLFLNNYGFQDAHTAAARPVITLSAGAPFTVDETKEDALGSKENPYKIIVENN